MPNKLSPRLQQVESLLEQGLAIDQIAGIMGIRPTSVEGYIDRINRRRGIRKMRHLVTQRQREVLELRADGHALKEIGARLGITKDSVTLHIVRACEHSGMDRHQLLSLVTRSRILAPLREWIQRNDGVVDKAVLGELREIAEVTEWLK